MKSMKRHDKNKYCVKTLY